ncbi:sulfatase-like hydrolase/transferase [Pirellulales bacterium]|nr:sulfatase-like hydrolase/transferase [Pirellulales bacterium]
MRSNHTPPTTVQRRRRLHYNAGMPPRHAICIVVDGLRAAALGAYGGCGVATPWLDRLASESIVANSMWAAGSSLSDFYDAVGSGQHGFRLASSPAGEASDALYSSLAGGGVDLHAVTDDRAIATRWENANDIKVELLDVPQSASASTVDETSFARLFAVAAEQLLEPSAGENSRLLWIHSQGWHGPWDAPLELRQMLLDEDDPPPESWVDPPQDIEANDPDELLTYRTAYGAQASVLDECAGGLLAALAASPAAEQTLVILAGARGFALGEHGRLGCNARQLFSEFLHVPLLICEPGHSEPRLRDMTAIDPSDITATLLDWFDVESRVSPVDGRNLLNPTAPADNASRLWHGCRTGDEAALKTPAWMLRQSGVDDDGSGLELFVKPDDRWEANEISSRCDDIPQQLIALQETLEQQAAAGEPLCVDPLPEELVDPAR